MNQEQTIPPGILKVRHNNKDEFPEDEFWWETTCPKAGCQVIEIQVNGQRFSVGEKVICANVIAVIHGFVWVGDRYNRWEATFGEGLDQYSFNVIDKLPSSPIPQSKAMSTPIRNKEELIRENKTVNEALGLTDEILNSKEWQDLKWHIGQILWESVSLSEDGKAIELNPGTHEVAAFVYRKLYQKARPQVTEEELSDDEVQRNGMAKILNKYLSNRDIDSEWDIYKAMREYAEFYHQSRLPKQTKEKVLPRKHEWVEVPVDLKRILNKYVGPDNSNKTKKNRLACGSEIMNWIEAGKQQEENKRMSPEEKEELIANSETADTALWVAYNLGRAGHSEQQFTDWLQLQTSKHPQGEEETNKRICQERPTIDESNRVHYVDVVRRYLKWYDKADISFSRFVELLNEDAHNFYQTIVGQVLPGEHPDEIQPRGKTWLEERRNWQSEIASLKSSLAKEAIKKYIKSWTYNLLDAGMKIPYISLDEEDQFDGHFDQWYHRYNIIPRPSPRSNSERKKQVSTRDQIIGFAEWMAKNDWFSTSLPQEEVQYFQKISLEKDDQGEPKYSESDELTAEQLLEQYLNPESHNEQDKGNQA